MGTIHKPLEELEARRIIERRQGRGNFVLDQSSDGLTLRLSRVCDKHGNLVCDREAVMLSLEIAPANSIEREHQAKPLGRGRPHEAGAWQRGALDLVEARLLESGYSSRRDASLST